MDDAGDMTKKKTIYTRQLHMQGLPGCEYYLYTLLREQLMLITLRDVFVTGMRLMYAVGHDPGLRPILINIAADVKNTNLDTLMMQPKERQPHYDKMPF